jgi:predicted nucleic acid-binding protein
MLLVIDSSVVAKWFFTEEELQEQAAAVRQDWMSSVVQPIAPDLIFTEVSNIVWKRQRLGLVTEGEGNNTIVRLLGLGISTVEPQALLLRAYSLARQFDRTVYDSLYLALATETQSRFVTADLRLYNAVSLQLGFVQYLAEY